MDPHYYILRTSLNQAPKVKHRSRASAVIEAERLARQHPGEPFEILKCVALVQTIKACTFWVDGESEDNR